MNSLEKESRQRPRKSNRKGKAMSDENRKPVTVSHLQGDVFGRELTDSDFKNFSPLPEGMTGTIVVIEIPMAHVLPGETHDEMVQEVIERLGGKFNV